MTSFIIFTPWELLWAWLQHLPETIQEEVNKAKDYGFEGAIAYVDEFGKEPHFILQVGTTVNRKFRQRLMHYSKLPASINYTWPRL